MSAMEISEHSYEDEFDVSVANEAISMEASVKSQEEEVEEGSERKKIFVNEKEPRINFLEDEDFE